MQERRELIAAERRLEGNLRRSQRKRRSRSSEPAAKAQRLTAKPSAFASLTVTTLRVGRSIEPWMPTKRYRGGNVCWRAASRRLIPRCSVGWTKFPEDGAVHLVVNVVAGPLRWIRPYGAQAPLRFSRWRGGWAHPRGSTSRVVSDRLLLYGLDLPFHRGSISNCAPPEI